MPNDKIKGIMWMMMSLVISCANDSISKYLDSHISAYQIIFCRFAFGALLLFPFIITNVRTKYGSLRTKHIKTHVLRGSLLSIAMLLWLKAMAATSLTVTTMMSFTIPFFTLMLAQILLHEKVSAKLWLFTFFGFTGATLGINIHNATSTIPIFLFISAATIFALLDIINKKLISQSENSMPMLFYSNAFAAIFICPLALLSWHTMSLKTISLLIILSAGGNFILYCILKAYKYCTVSYLAPLRYIEFILSTMVSYAFFHEKLTFNTIVGAMIVFICSLVIIKSERHQANK